MPGFSRKAPGVWLGLFFVLSAAAALSSQIADEDLIKNMSWRNIGPANMSGRISDIVALDDDFTHVLVASASGGVWKSVNAGTTWEPIFDRYGSASIGDVAVFQKNPDIIWVGTGEECSRNSVAWGDGIYKSVDGGKTFIRMGLETTQVIGRVLTHPDDPDVVYAAATGPLWGFTGDRGLFKTENGGETWIKLGGGLPNDGRTGAIDLVMHPENPDILYVGFWQRIRRPWRFDSGGPNGGIFRTEDGGKTWTKLKQGLPKGDLGRIGLAISRSNPEVLMAVVEHGFQPPPMIQTKEGRKPNPEYEDMTKLGSGIYRSEDGGRSWMYMNRMNDRPFYYSHIYINPFDDNLIYYLATNLHMSEDGGKTLKTVPGLHPDFHAMWLDPTNRNRYYVGQDGGAALTHDHGNTWILFDNKCISQFYAVSADMRDPYYVYGGLQDNGTWAGPGMSREGTILTDFWFNLAGGDGFHTQNDPTDWRTLYAETQGGNIMRINVETRETARIRPSPQNTYNWKDHLPKIDRKKSEDPAPEGQPMPFRRTQMPFRFNWSSPILISPHNPHTVYFGGNHVFMSVNRGDNWRIISPDLTTNDPEKYARPTGGITLDQTGAETHCTIISISESPITPGLIWVGTDDGNVQLTRNGGVSWTNVRANVAGVPAGTWVSRVEASRFDEGTCYLSFDGHRSDDFRPYAFKTTDFGRSWTSISGDLPDGEPVYVIREDLKNKNLLFAGTEFSVFFSRNGGTSWTRLNLNMPTVAFHDLIIHPRDNDLIAGTHGRGIWILDDISPLQEAADDVLSSDVHLFKNERPGTQWYSLRRGGYGRGDLYFRGENPAEGAAVHFYLKEKPAGPVTVEITDVTGELKTVYTLKDPDAGIHRMMWDMRFDPPPAQAAQVLAMMRGQIGMILQRPEVGEEAKAVVQEALDRIQEPGLGFRNAMDIVREAFEAIGYGAFMRFRGGPAMGAVVAEPGIYAVKLTAGDRTSTGTVSVRRDPMLER